MNQPLNHAAIPIVIIGDAQDIREFLCGPIQHDEHCKGWRWHQFIGDREARWQAVKAEFKKMHGKEMEDVQ
jgi:hypothetical protein